MACCDRIMNKKNNLTPCCHRICPKIFFSKYYFFFFLPISHNSTPASLQFVLVASLVSMLSVNKEVFDWTACILPVCGMIIVSSEFICTKVYGYTSMFYCHFTKGEQLLGLPVISKGDVVVLNCSLL